MRKYNTFFPSDCGCVMYFCVINGERRADSNDCIFQLKDGAFLVGGEDGAAGGEGCLYVEDALVGAASEA